MSATKIHDHESNILARVVRPNRKDMSPELARAFLQLEFDDRDRARMHELALKAQEGTLAGDELEEMESYRRIGYFLDLLRSKARRILKTANPR
jgi:hypothetical protein